MFWRPLLKPVARCVNRKVLAWNIMSKRPVQSPPEKKLKLNQGTTNTSENGSTTEKYNLRSNSVSGKNMQSAENKMTDTNLNPNSTNEAKSKIKVEYLGTPIKSENDKKDYRVIKLENGLTALLIADLHSRTSACENDDDDDQDKVNAISSEAEDEEQDDEEDEESDEDDEDDEDDDEDEEEDDEKGENGSDQADADDGDSGLSKRVKREEKMAACGLCVGVGSFSDPPEIPGMAHFLEHMVFMGSEKYPQENDFDAFIRKRGGYDNAGTTCEHTTFYFEIQEKFLLAALDRFAQFFISPLMKRDAITRERKAVESEFQMALPSDFYRKEQLFCSFARPGHPATKFTWGNLVTLRDNVSDEKLYEELHKFRERHYSAHRMTVAIQARLPLDTLEEYVTQCFANVPNNGLPPDDFTVFKGPESFDTPAFTKMYKIKPIKDLCQIQLTWAMPPFHDLYKSKPHQYISWIIGHEGKGSLIAYLRKKMWCLDIVSGNGESDFEHSSMYALFSLGLLLTEEGHKHLEEVLNAIFSYINLMRKEGPQKRIYDEVYQIEANNFRFRDEVSPEENVEDLCENMYFYPPEDYIQGSELYLEYNPKGIEMCINFLRADNVNIIISDKKFNDDEFEKVEPWFNTKYTDVDIPAEWVQRWKIIEPLPDFHLPLPNVFLTDNFSLITMPSEVPKYPVKIHGDSKSEIWYRPDPKFGFPECYMYFYLISPLMNISPENAALMDLFVGILKQLLVEELYPASAAGLDHQIYTNQKGIIVKVNGFNQKLPLLLNTIIKYIADCPNLVTKELFNVMKEEQIKKYYNTFLKPGKLVKDVRLSILMLVHWPAVDRHAAISGIEFQQFQTFVKHFTDHIYIKSLVQGNMTQEDVIKNVESCIDTLNYGPLLPNTMPELRVTEIPKGIYNCKVMNFNKTDVNSVVTNYYQSGKASIKLSVMIDILIMIMEEPLFTQLRTQEQLGYNVSCVMRDTYGILGYSVTVCTQADKFTTDHADERIEKFLQSFNKTLSQTSEKELDSVKEALIKMKQCADIHLKEEVDRNWHEIVSRDHYVFDRIEKEVLMIERIKIDELREWMASHTINGNNLRKLSVHVIGTSSKDKADGGEDVPVLADAVASNNGGKVKYPLEYLVDAQDAKKSSRNQITSIEDYKRGLYVFPNCADL